jgi:iron-sulfur cluster assembly protein
MSISLTQTAASEIKSIIKDQGLSEAETRLRVGVKGGGCSGFSYMLDLTEEPRGEADEEMESQGVKILCDMKSFLYLSGAEIDFRDEVMGRGWERGRDVRDGRRSTPEAPAPDLTRVGSRRRPAWR